MNAIRKQFNIYLQALLDQRNEPLVIVSDMDCPLNDWLDDLNLQETSRLIKGRAMLTKYLLPNGNVIEQWNIGPEHNIENVQQDMFDYYQSNPMYGMIQQDFDFVPHLNQHWTSLCKGASVKVVTF